ncbi:MAG: hypothetical protein RMK30_10020 [Anaerolineae bacterium]|nr:hypothetical protein [Anaerolineae bacterium]
MAEILRILDPLSHHRPSGYVAHIPTPKIEHSRALSQLACEAHDLLREWATGDETATVFIAPWLLQAWWACQGREWEALCPATGHPLAREFAWSDWESARRIRCAVREAARAGEGILFPLARACVLWEQWLRERLEEIQRAIDDEVYRLYEISEEDRALIEREVARSAAEPEEAEAEEAAEAEPEEEEPVAGLLTPEEHIRRLVHYLAHQALREDEDGIVPLADGHTADNRLEYGLPHRVRARLRALFGEEAEVVVERELRQALGKPLEEWLATDFFGYHVGLYRRRPVIWQIVPPSGRRRPTADLPFSVFIYWHRLDADTLRKIRYLYLQRHLEAAQRETQRAEQELAALRGKDAPFRQQREAERRLQEVVAHRDTLQALAERLEALLRPQALRVESRSEWVKAKVNEIVAEGYRPNLDYGVRVNIEPLKQAGILPPDGGRVKG